MELSCLLDIKRLVCDLARAVVNHRQLQAAECRRADFIFDPSDLHKLLVLEKIKNIDKSIFFCLNINFSIIL